MRLSILIVNWNTRDLLLACLASIERYPPLCSYEVIVVDNDSSDDSVEQVLKNFPKVRMIASAENLGFARANNLALKSAQGELILLLNPDTEVHADALNQAVRRLEADPTIGILGVKQLESDGQVQASWGHAPSLRTLGINALGSLCLKLGLHRLVTPLFSLAKLNVPPVRSLKSLWNPEQEQYVGWIMGSFLLMPAPLAHDLGLFDERFSMYGEDMDLGLRVNQANKKVLYFPGAVITHHGGASTTAYAAQADAAHFLATLRFYQKHNGRLQTMVYRFILLLIGCINWLRYWRDPAKQQGARLKALIAIAPERWRWP